MVKFIPSTEKGKKKAVVILLSFFVFIIYLALHTHFRIYYVDDSWISHYIYSFQIHGLDIDTIFRPADSIYRYLFFQKSFHALYGTIFDIVGWTKSAGHLLSTLFLFLSAGLWVLISKKLKFPFKITVASTFSILIFPAFFSAANMTRPETMTLFFIFAAFLLFLYNRFFLSALIGVIGMEIHLMGILFLFYILAYVIYQRKAYWGDKRFLVKGLCYFAAGGMLGVFYYYLLHKNLFDQYDFQLLFDSLKARSSMGSKYISNYIAAYFFPKAFLKNMPELVLFLVASVLFFWKKVYKEHRFIGILFVVLLLSTFLTRRSNGNYMIYVYPAISLMLFATFDKLKVFKGFAISLIVYLSVFYGAHWVLHHKYNPQQTIEKTATYFKDKKIPISGMPEFWYAAIDRDFYPIYPSSRKITPDKIKHFYLVKSDYFGYRSKNYKKQMKYYKKNYSWKKLGEFNAGGEHRTVSIFYCEVNPK